ncbi:MAG: glycosyltransferase [Opitutaceae bacterium]|nr:glycosyltransferase [Opitutaceae bacterium]
MIIEELKYVIRNKLPFRAFILSIKKSIIVIQHYISLQQLIRSHGKLDVCYCYWNNEICFAATLLKGRGISKVVSRVHRHDLYEYEKRDSYMPLKRQFINQIDEIHTLSSEAMLYIIKTYSASPSRISISPLGVRLPTQISEVSKDGYLNVISVSYCVDVKRIDRIIDGIFLYARHSQPTNIIWHHIGDGPLLRDLEEYAKSKFRELENVKYKFFGALSNGEVIDYYKENEVDVFINTSESEGVPVSIMEAMSFGIPAIAPDVGGMKFLVTDKTGLLLNANGSPNDLAYALGKLVKSNLKAKSFRIDVREFIKTNFNSDVNYERFITQLITK